MVTEAVRLLKLEAELESLVSGGRLPLPAYPTVVQRAQQVMSRDEYGLDEVAQLIASDASLAADVVRCANSAMYRRGAPVTNLAQAVTRVGARQVERLILASCLSPRAQSAGPLATLRRIIWIEGLASAALCQELARIRGLRQEEAFLLGLIHDFGKIVAFSHVEALCEKHGLDTAWPTDVWADLVGRHHVAIGLALAKAWELPQLVREVISAHHGGPGECADPGLLGVVKTTDQVVERLMKNPGIGEERLALIPGVMNLSEREALVHVTVKVPELVAAFETPVPTGTVPPTHIAHPESTLERQTRPVEFAVTVKLSRQTREYKATTIAPNGLALTGELPLDEGRLHEVTVHGVPGPLHMWALTRVSRRAGSSYQVEMHPFALSGMERVLWNQLVAGVPAAA